MQPMWARVSTSPSAWGRLANIFFVLLFPLFYLYHYALASGWMPPFLQGWFGPISLVATVVLGPSILLALGTGQSFARWVVLAGFISLLVLALVVAVANYLFGDQSIMSEALKQHFGLVVAWIALFAMGYWLQPGARFLFWSTVLLYVMAAIAWWHVDLSRMMFYAAQDLRVSEGVATYQGFARSFSITAMLVLAYERRLWRQLLVVGVSTATLFILGARSEWVAFLAVVAIWFWLVHREKRRYVGFAILLLLALFVTGSIFTLGKTSSRQLEVMNLATSTSWQGRKEVLAQGWENILAHPILGDFGGHIRTSSVGGYIHNVLSAWLQLGLLGFVLYTGLSLFAFFASLRAVVRKRSPSSLAKLTVFISASSLLLLVVAKSVFWGVPALAWGLTGNLYRTRGEFSMQMQKSKGMSSRHG